MSDKDIINTIAERIPRTSWLNDKMLQETARFILDGLRTSSCAVIELPAQCIIPTGWGDDCLGAWPIESGYVDPVSAWPNNEVALPDGEFIPAAKARSLAAALLAAADKADELENTELQDMDD